MSTKGNPSIPTPDSGDAVSTDLVSTFSPKHGATVGESLGSEAIAGHIQGEHGEEVRVSHTDLQLDPDIDELMERIAERPPQILGISVKIGALDQTEEIMRRFNAVNFPAGKKPLVVMGGVMPTFATTALLERYPETIMAVKEGENAAAALIEVVRGDKRLDQVPGIWYVSDGSVKKTIPQRLDLAHRHLPARITTKRIHDLLRGMIWAEASRGCGFNCTFCSIRELHGGGFDGNIKPESVVADLKRLRELGIQSVSFTDDDFGGDPERTAVLARLLKESGLGMQFSISTRADHVWDERVNHRNDGMTPQAFAKHNKRLLEIMSDLRDAGLVRVFLGMESGSPSQLKRYGKLVTVEGNYKAIDLLRSLDIDVVAGYIPIDPLMTIQELKENVEFLRKTGMYRKITNPLSVLRVQAGSPYLKLAQRAGIIDEPTEDLVFYKARFKDLAVQKVAELADQWVQEMYPFIFGLKGEVATVTMGPGGVRTPQAEAVENILFAFRELEMNFIGSLTNLLSENPDGNTDPIVERLKKTRLEIVRRCEEQASRGDFGDSPKLLQVIREYAQR